MRTFIGALILTAVLAAAAPAQFNVPVLPPGGQITSVPTTFAQSPYNVPYSAVRPVYSYGGAALPNYGGIYVQDPIGGYYNGISSLVGAYGQYGKDYQRARLLSEDVERSKMTTRRLLIEQQRWEQSLIPTSEDVRVYKMERDRRRALNDPPLSEIISGDALNIVLQTVQNAQGKGGYGPMVPLDKDLVDRLNLTATPGGNIALFKDGGKLRWPFVLRDTPFDSDRERVQDLVYKAVKETQADNLSPATLRELKGAVGVIDATLEKMGPEMSIPDSIQARRFVDEVRDGVKALEQPNAADYLNKKWKPESRSVGDLVAYMTRTGLRFAPALQGEEGPYRALHQALVSYSLGALQSMRK